MANQSRRLKPEQLEEDESGFAALQVMAGYAPVNQAYTLAAITAAYENWQSALTKEARAEAAHDAARDDSVACAWEFHNLMLGAKDQATAQFGRNSNEVQALKLKKASERKAPTRGKKGGSEK